MRMGMPPKGPNFEPKPRAKNQKATMLRLLHYVMRHYRFSFVVVFGCIIVSSAATLLSTLFTQQLIDKYIVPLMGVANPN